MLVLSLFPGIDLFGRGFEAEGFCVVRGPDLLWGGDVRDFHPPADVFDGIIGGSPCQDFSKARRSAPTGYGLEMLHEFERVIKEAQPRWFLLENVPTVPDLHIEGYTIQRLDLNARECGASQNRPRHFQFGSKSGLVIVPARAATKGTRSQPAAMATEGKKMNRRTWSDFCELQGLPEAIDLPGMTRAARYVAVGNGVHVEVARTLARAVKEAINGRGPVTLCACNCGRPIHGRQTYATAACRKRIQRRRRRDSPDVAAPRGVTEKYRDAPGCTTTD